MRPFEFTSLRHFFLYALAATLVFVLAYDRVNAQSALISYQGILTTAGGNVVADSTYSLGFALFDVPVGGAPVWNESAVVSTSGGRFSHTLGSSSSLPRALFRAKDSLFLQVTLDAQALQPRTRISPAAYAVVAHDLRSVDSLGVVAIASDPSAHSMVFTDSIGDTTIMLQGGISGDSAVILPDNSIAANEIIDEPGISVEYSVTLVTLPTSEMVDLVVVEITIPTNGYILLHGKCYAILSGTTGPNRARVQIDDIEGGSAVFPHYTIAGLGGYVNTGESYFPMYVTRAYFKTAGTYEFRLEGKTDHSLPAVARTWDHVLTAVFYPTQYENVKSTVFDPAGYRRAVPLPTNDSLRGYKSPPVYDVDLKDKVDESSSRK